MEETSESVVKRFWATDICWEIGHPYYGYPVEAHLVVDPAEAPETGQWPNVLVTACGQRLTRFNHAEGWAVTSGDELPLDAYAIHCGLPSPPRAGIGLPDRADPS